MRCDDLRVTWFTHGPSGLRDGDSSYRDWRGNRCGIGGSTSPSPVYRPRSDPRVSRKPPDAHEWKLKDVQPPFGLVLLVSDV